ncbi:MAG: hypothetical protein IPF70_00020 [Saprospiraceae bacterium]|nr:hypothetical protein [Saprospiraceae bacterium]
MAKEVISKEFNWDYGVKIVLFVGRIGTQTNDTGVNENPVFALNTAEELVKRGDEWKIILAGFKGELGDAMEEK